MFFFQGFYHVSGFYDGFLPGRSSYFWVHVGCLSELSSFFRGYMSDLFQGSYHFSEVICRIVFRDLMMFCGYLLDFFQDSHHVSGLYVGFLYGLPSCYCGYMLDFFHGSHHVSVVICWIPFWAPIMFLGLYAGFLSGLPSCLWGYMLAFFHRSHHVSVVIGEMSFRAPIMFLCGYVLDVIQGSHQASRLYVGCLSELSSCFWVICCISFRTPIMFLGYILDFFQGSYHVSWDICWMYFKAFVMFLGLYV